MHHTKKCPVGILPCDGDVQYTEHFFSFRCADQYYTALKEDILWMPDIIKMFGKQITTKRRVAWYADAGLDYTYAGVKKHPLPWVSVLTEMRNTIEARTCHTYNSCLLNLYHDGSEGMGWHADNEKQLLKGGAIASLSLGAARKFAFKHNKTKETISLMLAHGSLLLMKGKVQDCWKHRLPPTKKSVLPRINLTFRTVISSLP